MLKQEEQLEFDIGEGVDPKTVSLGENGEAEVLGQEEVAKEIAAAVNTFGHTFQVPPPAMGEARLADDADDADEADEDEADEDEADEDE